MVYSSLLFIYGFLPASLLIYHLTPVKFREAVLLMLSMVFCGMTSLYFFIFISVYSLINYSFANIIEKLHKNEKLAAVPLAAGIIIDLTAAFAFRTEYFSWLHRILKAPESFYPVGIAFFTLSAVGTLIDVYKGKIRPGKHIIRFLLYIMFFPRLIMGPLLRYGVFTKILDNRRESFTATGVGMTVFIKGLAKKVIAADNLYMLFAAAHADNEGSISAATAWLGITAYVFCLYFTLSGFADMGTGIAYCFGLKFPQSFNYPLLSTRIRYFASRWHSQFVQWIRRYVTKPLYSICPRKWMREIIFVFGWALFCFWYTVSLNGIICGALMGIVLIIENHLLNNKIMNFTGMVYTFLVVVVCAVFLSGSSPSASLRYLLAMIGGNGVFVDSQALYLFKSYIVLLLVSMYASTDLFRNLMMRSHRNKVKTVIVIVSPVVLMALLLICTSLISYNGSSEMLLMKL
ncbi:MBOAT family O-acyltransferase [Ruminococcus flavefaciens]|uniref:Alginate O-acetyltransferase n=1 Tax=Ruminococcus flavefaciens 007c TaxID=1341157 RepID=W7UE97_RUMFL|nr:MBOAT family O-acyltransferase [Ruminococcus flavefaciens]EWM53481.1 hypothetical protein RF007C_07310 [Ruminococcus flavefaciens 007c]